MSTLVYDQRLELPRRGSRSYARGADIYLQIAAAAECIAGTGEVRDVVVSFHRLLTSQGRLCVYRGPAPREPRRAPVEFSFRAGNLHFAGRIAATDLPLAASVPWNEQAIEAGCVICASTVRVGHVPGHLPIDRLVCATKVLHNRLYPIAGMRWIFSRIELHQPLPADDGAEIVVECLHNFNNRITKSVVAFRGEAVGWIFFSPMPA